LKLEFCRQFVDREKSRTKTAAVELSGTLLDNRKRATGDFIDLKKAFDLIDNNVLLYVLEIYEVRGLALDSFRDYLGNRRQKVKVHGITSDEEELSRRPRLSSRTPSVQDLHKSYQITTDLRETVSVC
jgi:hypothetical protein